MIKITKSNFYIRKANDTAEVKTGYIFNVDGVNFGVYQLGKGLSWSLTEITTGLCGFRGDTRKICVEKAPEIAKVFLKLPQNKRPVFTYEMLKAADIAAGLD